MLPLNRNPVYYSKDKEKKLPCRTSQSTIAKEERHLFSCPLSSKRSIEREPALSFFNLDDFESCSSSSLRSNEPSNIVLFYNESILDEGLSTESSSVNSSLSAPRRLGDFGPLDDVIRDPRRRSHHRLGPSATSSSARPDSSTVTTYHPLHFHPQASKSGYTSFLAAYHLVSSPGSGIAEGWAPRRLETSFLRAVFAHSSRPY